MIVDLGLKAIATVKSLVPERFHQRGHELRSQFEEKVVRPAALSTVIRRTDNFGHVTWLGRPVWQNVTDAWLLQETIVERGVDLVIECGTNRGGSAFFMATVFDLLGNDGHIVTIDIISMVDFSHPRITFLEGSSVEESTVQKVRDIIRERKPKQVMVLLDSDHFADHVLAEMQTYAEFVTPGSYLYVEDGCIDELPTLLPQPEPGPLDAIHRFLEHDTRFVVDKERSERYLITHSPSGWLERVTPS